MTSRTPIKVLQSLKSGEEVLIKGWVRSIRSHKNVQFIDVNDGSSFSSMQIVAKDTQVKSLTVGCSIECLGKILHIPSKSNTKVELQALNVNLIGKSSTETYPLQKKYQTLEFLREHLHLRARTNTFGAVTRVRNALSHGIHSYFQENGFYHIHTPILTTNDAEGAGDLFKVTRNSSESSKKDEFFGRPTFLTVSGQLHAEMYACAMSKVYTFGPTFRAENSNTSRHLSEFWMVEPEIAFATLDDCINLAQGAVQASISYALDKCSEDLDFFRRRYDADLIMRLDKTVSQDFARITYTEAISILTSASKKFHHRVAWGSDLQTEHERYLAEEYFCCPVFVTDYPKDIKSFYMRTNPDDSTVAAMDLLVPRVGELIGGSSREEREDVLLERMKHFGLLSDDEETKRNLDWYMDLRRFGSAPHAGWGMGFERLITYTTGLDNIRDTISVPRYPGSCSL